MQGVCLIVGWEEKLVRLFGHAGGMPAWLF
jgi:hypothetical protein